MAGPYPSRSISASSSNTDGEHALLSLPWHQGARHELDRHSRMVAYPHVHHLRFVRVGLLLACGKWVFWRRGHSRVYVPPCATRHGDCLDVCGNIQMTTDIETVAWFYTPSAL